MEEALGQAENRYRARGNIFSFLTPREYIILLPNESASDEDLQSIPHHPSVLCQMARLVFKNCHDGLAKHLKGMHMRSSPSISWWRFKCVTDPARPSIVSRAACIGHRLAFVSIPRVPVKRELVITP